MHHHRRPSVGRVLCSLLVVAATLLPCLGCMHDSSPALGVGCVLPEPVAATETVLPSATVYYYILDIGPPPDGLLQSLLDDGLDVLAAWWPLVGSPCDCVECFTGIVVEVAAPDTRIESWGFTSGGSAFFNCGIASFDHYVIEGC